MKALDLVGKKFNRLLVVKKAGRKNYKVMWECVCDCGNTTFVNTFYLINSKIRSCGCLHKEQLIERNTTHNQRHTKLYETWKKMRDRCNRPNATQYKDYGGRGIKVCEEWDKSFQAFYDWSYANGYDDNLTIDRIDNNKGYSPDNCRWATYKEQMRNKRTNHIITYKNQPQCISKWCEELNLSYSAVTGRLRRGWSVEKALSTPTNRPFDGTH
jgi:hypothetical protein